MAKTSNKKRHKKTSCRLRGDGPVGAPHSQEKATLDWLNATRILVEQGQAKQAWDRLSEETIGRHLDAVTNPNLCYLARYELASLLFTIGQRQAALRYSLEAVKHEETAEIYNLIGLIYRSLNQCSKAIESLTEARKRDPKNLHIWNNLGLCLMKLGQGDEAVDLFRNAVRTDASYADAYSNLLLHLNYLPQMDPSSMLTEAKNWSQAQAPDNLARTDHLRTLDPKRKLRIGYISPDFREHPVMSFVRPLLSGHDRGAFEIYGYGNVQRPDPVTAWAVEQFDRYHTIQGLDAQAVVELIESDKIDILVDLAGHTQGHRLDVMARKPAPIQVTYCGYPNTTGLSQIDYRLTDAIVDSLDQQPYYTEELVFLPNGFLCYHPGDVQPLVTAAPAATNQYVTFGCFNNINKVNRPLMQLWVEILQAVAGSKLLLKFGEASDESVRTHYLSVFRELGLDNAGKRIVFSGYLPSPQHLELYNAVDIALDTFPYNGTTTTFQSLLMGVPVVTLAGTHHAGRVGLDILSRLDMQFFAAETPADYVKKAVALAMKPDALTPIRATMRQRLAASPWCNGPRITIEIEQAYRMMWDQYCQEQIKRKWRQRSASPAEPARPTPAPNAPRRGIFYVVWGDSRQAEDMLEKSIASVRQHHPELPIHIERFKDGGKINKTKICDLSPFDETAYLDNDTIVLGRLDYAFEKAGQFGLACCLNENPWARRYCDNRLSGDMVEYNAGVLFFSKKAKPLFDRWRTLFEAIDGSIFHFAHDQLSYMPVANQGSLALAVHETGFNPFVLPHNWNFRPAFHAHFAGPIKIWHGYEAVPDEILTWNAEQTAENAILKCIGGPPKTAPSAATPA